MLKYIYNKVFSVLCEKPVKLWGMSLLATLLTALASICGVLPIISIPVSLVISYGMMQIFLSGYRRKDFVTEDLFVGFHDFWRVAGGLCWVYLWIFIWGLIPIAGPVFAIIKAYSYRFTPYILADNKEVAPTQAIKLSMKITDGYKGKMFGADILVFAAALVCVLVLLLLGMIKYIGILFLIVMVVVYIAMMAVLPLVYGLLGAAYYDEISGGVSAEKFAAYEEQTRREKELKLRLKQQMNAQVQQMREQMALEMQQAASAEASAKAQPQVDEATAAPQTSKSVKKTASKK